MERTKKCKHCGKDFIANDKRTSYCSKLCKNQARYQKGKSTKSYTKICKQCGIEFTTPNKSVELCSFECRGRYAAIVGEDKRKLHRDTASALEKRRATRELNGGHPMHRQGVKEKLFNTYKERTGYDHPMHNPDDVKKQIDSMNNVREKGLLGNAICEYCGCDFIKNSTYQKYCNDCKKIAIYETRRDKKCPDCGKLIIEGSDRCSSCRARFDYNNNEDVKNRLDYSAEKHSISKLNKEWKYEIENRFGIDVSFEHWIGGKRFDLYIGNNTVIDINPTFTHSSTQLRDIEIKTNSRYRVVKNDYHLDKARLGRNNGYTVINVFDRDDKEKVLNLINPNKNKIYARDCVCNIISQNDGIDFLNKYHLQGSTSKNKNTIYYGLFYEGMLVEVISFGDPRYNKKCEYELLRLCSHKDYNIIGGASKLFSHFVEDKNPKSIVSYCDKSKFDGGVYISLGFDLVTDGKPSKHWCFNQILKQDKDNIEQGLGRTIHKPEKNKRHITDNYLRQRGFDQLFGDLYGTYGKGSSNEELMIKHGFLEVYDCGQSTFVRHNPNKKEST